MKNLLGLFLGACVFVVFVPTAFVQRFEDDARTPRELKVLKSPKQGGTMGRVIFSPDSKILASTGGNIGTVLLWECSSGKLLGILQGKDGNMISVEFSHDGKTVISGGGLGDVRFWD